MRTRYLLALLLVASCTKTALNEPTPASETPSETDAGLLPTTTDAGPSAVVDATPVEAGRCSDLPAYVCNFSLGSCLGYDGIGIGGNGLSNVVEDGGPDGTRAFWATLDGGGPGGGFYVTGFGRVGDAGEGCNLVCDFDLRLATPDPSIGTWVTWFQVDKAANASRLEVGDAGWIHTGENAPAAHAFPVTTDWFHARLAITLDPNDAGATSTLTLSGADASPPSSTMQHLHAMMDSLRVGVGGPAGTSPATAYADNIVCRSVD